jgi:subtilase family serine protease
VLVATEDRGVVQNLATADGQCGHTTKTPDTAAWDDSPWITAVGGTVPNLNGHGKRLGPDPLRRVEGICAAGAGYSAVFPRPAYQDKVARITRSRMRSVRDITMDSSDGTSDSPMLAGVIALATQLNHGDVGPINNVLINVLGPAGRKPG